METLHDVAKWFWDGISLFFSGMIGAAMVGRLAWHTRLVQQGKRKFFGWELVYEIPIVGFVGYVGVGLSTWLHLDPGPAGAVCAVLGWFGPAGVQALIQGFAKAKGVDIEVPKEETKP